MAARTVVELDGDSLEIDDVIKISEGECYVKVHVLMLGLSFSGMHACFYMYLHILRMFLCIQLSEEAEKKVKASRNVVDGVVKDGTGRLIASLASGSSKTSLSSSVWGSLRLAPINVVYVELIFSTVACMQLSMVSTLDLELWERKPFHPISLSKPA